MSIVRLRYVDRFEDRHGRTRYYFRKGKGARRALPGKPGSQEFMLSYNAALHDEKPTRGPAKRGAPGTFDRLVQDYYASTNYLRMAPSTRRNYQLVIDRLIRDENIGHRLVVQMTRQHVQQIIGRRADTPGAAHDLLKKIKILLHFAIDNSWRKDDPTLRLKNFKLGEFHTWTEEEIAQFEGYWAIGTRERTAFALLVYTGQRASDVKSMSWSDQDKGAIRVVQRKTGAKLWIASHPALTEVLAAWPKTHHVMLTTTFGKSFTSKGFSNFMADKIGEAGLPERCVTHGLRKAAGRRLAEAGCSTKEIAAILGHESLKEVERYTKAAEQKKLAAAAIRRLKGYKTRTKILKPL